MNTRLVTMGFTAVAVGAVIMFHSTAPAQTPYVSLTGQEVDGKAIYLKSCKECHGVLGAPTKAAMRKYDKIPDFTKEEFFKAKKHEELIEAIEKGKGRDMKGFSEKLSKDEIKAVMVYVHTLAKKA